MSGLEPVSGVAHLRQQICLEYEAAQQGLYGLSLGNARHTFITKKLENMWSHHSRLKELLGEQEAGKMLQEILEQMGSDEQTDHDH